MDKLKESLHIAFANLLSNVIRSILSVTGIVIGISSVITILSLGAGAKKNIMQSVQTMGAHVIHVYGRYDENTQRMGTLEMDDIGRIKNLPLVATAFPQIHLYKEIRTRAANVRGSIVGTDSGYLKVKGLELAKGRNFSPVEMETRALLCLINEAGSRIFFPNKEELGQTIYLEDVPWTVIGVYKKATPRGLFRSSRTRKNENNEDVEVLAPLPVLIRNSKDISIPSIEVHIRPEFVTGAEAELEKAMERDDPNRKGLFRIRSQQEFLDKSIEINRLLSLIGVIVAGISLLVGGIGMMNVMLTAVAERTREIGLRRAVGARKMDILLQFLTESCVLSVSGGVLGLIGGAALARILPLFLKGKLTVSALIEPHFLILAVGTGIVLGVIFGFYPAVKASKLSPAEALRSE